MDNDLFNNLWEQHELLVELSRQAFVAYSDSLAAPRTSKRCASSKELEAAYNSAKTTELEVMNKITDML